MAFKIGTVVGFEELLIAFNTFVTTELPLAERWTVLRDKTWDSSSTERYIWKAPGLSTTEEIFLMSYANYSTQGDWYNLYFGAATGYVESNPYNTQPGFSGWVTLPAWNQQIYYWFTGNGQRANIFIKVETVYMSAYIGKFFPYATPNQFFYPVCVSSMIDGSVSTRYSDTSMVSGWKGTRANCKMRFITGTWRTPDILPYVGEYIIRTTAELSATASGYYGLTPLILSENVTGYVNVYGELDGVYFITGFNNTVENVLTIGTTDYIVMRDHSRTGFFDYIALRLS